MLVAFTVFQDDNKYTNSGELQDVVVHSLNHNGSDVVLYYEQTIIFNPNKEELFFDIRFKDIVNTSAFFKFITTTHEYSVSGKCIGGDLRHLNIGKYSISFRFKERLTAMLL